LVPVLFTVYIQGVLKFNKNNSSAKRLNRVEHVLLMKVVLVGHQHRAHKTTRAAENFFSTEIQKLVERYKKYIVLQGDYVEK